MSRGGHCTAPGGHRRCMGIRLRLAPLEGRPHVLGGRDRSGYARSGDGEQQVFDQAFFGIDMRHKYIPFGHLDLESVF